MIDATEDAACALSLAAVEVEHGLVAVHRAYHGSGADYFVAPAGSDPVEALEFAHRLEVSGISKGELKDLSNRINRKIKQAKDGASTKPAYAAVVEFSAPHIRISDVILP